MLGCDKVVSFGDGKNDISMFDVSDECYAVENADPELKRRATAVIESNDNDGVARWLLEHWQNSRTVFFQPRKRNPLCSFLYRCSHFGIPGKGKSSCRPSGQGALPLSLLELHSAAVVRPHGQPELAYLGKVIGHVGFPVSRV